MKVAGIDYSINGPSITIVDTDLPFCFENTKTFFLTKTKKHADVLFGGKIVGGLLSDYSTQEERFFNNAKWLVDLCVEHSVEHCLIEDYAMAAKGRVFHIGENCGAMKGRLWAFGIPFDVVAPQIPKKAATGKGNADKALMHDAFMAETGIDLKNTMTPDKKAVDSPVADIVDSYFIAKLCHEKFS